jgi:hypothetical protein
MNIRHTLTSAMKDANDVLYSARANVIRAEQDLQTAREQHALVRRALSAIDSPDSFELRRAARLVDFEESA